MMSKEEENKVMSLGIPPKSFYSSSKNESPRSISLKRRLQTACESVKSKRMQDYILSDKLYKQQLCEVESAAEESPPMIYRVFSKQNEALEFADRFTQFHVFATELNSDGKRNFLACHPQTFWRLLKAKSSDARHAYEVIGRGMHSKVISTSFFLPTCPHWNSLFPDQVTGRA